MSKNRRVALFVMFVASLTGCADNLAPHTAPETPTVGSDRATVTGHIVDTTGAPVAGAAVALRGSGEHAVVDSTGAFSLDVPANTTLTLAASAPNMAPTLLQQFLVSPGASAAVEIPMVTGDHFKSLLAMGTNASGGVVAVALKSMSGAGSVAGATVTLTPSLGRVMYAPTGAGMADPDPAMAAVMPSVVQADESYVWAVGVQPHVSIMQLALHGVSQVEPPYAIDDVTFPGSFTVDAGSLTLVTLFTK
jgi:Carboxypeptidase regulatory-like domain